MNSPALSPATRRTILLLSFATFASMMAQRICDAMPRLARVFAVSWVQAAQVASVFLASCLAGHVKGRHVDDFRIRCCQFGTPQTRMDAGGICATLMAQNKDFLHNSDKAVASGAG